ncbi:MULTISPECIES: Hsp20 family protein [Gammaproteobacteria]|uniref:Hsp20 family protein n=1 Tax=Gammaproteobacteria TaxID=1236 RepID=UPI000DCFFC78|nr:MULTISPECIES: Hsp20 family protein [Gammaproteobacteria]RTE86557.1 Hsp20 family protein [Aliidiomarina sp. B3213]TCZ90888.1 Hsp20 family protein [Lysobacter sp. N42]
MNTIDLTPLYRNSIGFDRLASMLDNALRGDTGTGGYPPYNIEAKEENQYMITIAVAGFEENELDIQTERGVLTVRGKKAEDDSKRKYLYQGIAARAFERKFNLAEHVEVTDAELRNGLLNIYLVKEIPEAMKPRSISIKSNERTLENKS